jgi:hypothetical protein
MIDFIGLALAYFLDKTYFDTCFLPADNRKFAMTGLMD